MPHWVIFTKGVGFPFQDVDRLLQRVRISSDLACRDQ
jgi:hypothetical protein